MPDVIAAVAPVRPRATSAAKKCRIQVRAEFLSVGGGILFGLFLLVVALFIMAMASPSTTSAQRFIAIVLFFGSIAYVVNSLTERMTFFGNVLTFDSLFSSKRMIPLDELEAVILTHEGFNLEKGMQSIEFRRVGHRPDRIALGPCWQIRKLQSFIRSISTAMNATADSVFHS